MSMRKILVQYIGSTLCLPELEREVDEIAVRDNDFQIIQRFLPERTCHIVKASRKYVLSDGTELFEDGCSICNEYIGEEDNYCFNCGARVVKE